jgi:hypothetical protein
MAGDIFCKNCCGGIVGVKFCGWGPGFLLPTSVNPFNVTSGEAWINAPVSTIPLQTYIDNINAYDMSSIPAGNMRLLVKDGDGHFNVGTGALTGESRDTKITPQFYGTNAPCTTSGYTAYGVFDPFFQGNPIGTSCSREGGVAGCALVTSSFISALYNPPPFSTVSIPHVVRCQIVYAASQGSGAVADFDWSSAVFEPLFGGGTGTVGVCGNMPAYMAELGCATRVGGMSVNIQIPSASLGSLPNPGSFSNLPYFKAKYWFLGDTCSNIP